MNTSQSLIQAVEEKFLSAMERVPHDAVLYHVEIKRVDPEAWVGEIHIIVTAVVLWLIDGERRTSTPSLRVPFPSVAVALEDLDMMDGHLVAMVDEVRNTYTRFAPS